MSTLDPRRPFSFLYSYIDRITSKSTQSQRWLPSLSPARPPRPDRSPLLASRPLLARWPSPPPGRRSRSPWLPACPRSRYVYVLNGQWSTTVTDRDRVVVVVPRVGGPEKDTKLHLQTPTVIIHAAERRFLFTTTSPPLPTCVVVGPPKKRPKRSNERSIDRISSSSTPTYLLDSLTSLHTPPFEIPTPDLEQHSSHCLDHGQEVGRRPLQG